MLWPKVVGQSGTARAAPVLVTRPPNTMSTSVTVAVTRARRCVTCCTGPARSSVSPRAGGRALAGRRRLGQPVLGRLRGAVLVGPAIDGGQRGPPVEVGRRRGRRPLQGVGVPRIDGGLLAREQAPEEVDDERDLGQAET